MTATETNPPLTLGPGDACVAVDDDGQMTPAHVVAVDEAGALAAPDDGSPQFRAAWGDIYLVPTGPRMA